MGVKKSKKISKKGFTKKRRCGKLNRHSREGTRESRKKAKKSKKKIDLRSERV